MPPRQTIRLSALAALLLAVLPGCGQTPNYEHTYTTRGIVVSLPGEKAYEEFIVHHETIPTYQSINGSVGMNEMAMSFPVPDQSILEGLAVGDKIELVFGERFEPKHRIGVISVKKLPAETELNLSKTTSSDEPR